MKLSYNWLSDFLDLGNTDIDEIAEKLTMGAFEVEEIEISGDKLEGEVVLGEILEINKHPNADKLQVTKTRISEDKSSQSSVQQIVCGANNIKVGQKIPVALVGSKVFNRHDGTSLEIKKSKIRGIESSGMLCSPAELGFSEDELARILEKQEFSGAGEGIYILHDPENSQIENLVGDYKTGTDIRRVLGFERDHVLEIGARSNRGDALSVIGQARELAALFNKKIKDHSKDIVKLDNIKNVLVDKNIETYKPEIDDLEDCYVFHTLAIEGLKVSDSPQWLKNRLEAMGIRSINNIVDVSNYVLLELGHPMHFYDRDKLNPDSKKNPSKENIVGTLLVRRARKDEAAKTLDELEHKLGEKNLVIADEKQTQSIAGVMGGYYSQITDSSKNIVIEVAAFNPAVVRRSSRASGIESESKKRFERGVDRSTTQKALLRAVELLSIIAKEQGHEITVGEILTAGSDKAEEKFIELELASVKRYLGVEIPKEEIIKLMEPLEIEFAGSTESTIKFSIPSFRQLDVYREEDLIEEVSRLYGYNNIPSEAPSSSVSVEKASDSEESRKFISQIMVSYGFSQACLSSLIGETIISKLPGAHNADLEISMQNPLSREHFVLRQNLLGGLIQAANRNYSYDRENPIKLFELGRAYFKSDKNTETGAEEVPLVSAIMIAKARNWDKREKESDFYDLKALVEEVYPRVKLLKFEDRDSKSKFKFDHIPEDLLHPSISAIITQDRREIGYVAKLHPSICEQWEIPEHSYIFEALSPSDGKGSITANLSEKKFKAIPNTPFIERDITVDFGAGREVSYEEIEKLIEKNSSKDFKKVELVSLYDDAGAERSSLSFRLRWHSATETLSGEEIDSDVNKIKAAIEKELEGQFRS